MLVIYRSPLELVGGTPLLQLTRIVPQSAANVYAKLEMYNLTGSVKDRSAMGMVEAAEKSGQLKRGSIIIESTSGNLGVALAAIAQRKGFKLICVIDPVSEVAKVNAMVAMGAQTYMVTMPDADGSYKTARRNTVQTLLRQMPEAINLGQYNNPSNARQHYLTTGPEIYKDLDGKVDMLVAAAGTCGTLCGTARYLKEVKPDIQVVGVEPVGSVLFGGTYQPFHIQGAGISFVPDNYDPTLLNEKLKIEDADAFAMVRLLASRESLLVGSSAGAAMYIALQKAQSMPADKNVVVIFPDHGGHYLDSIFSDEWLEERGLLSKVLDVLKL